MTTSLTIKCKAISLRGQLWIHDQDGQLLYDGSRPGIFSRTTHLTSKLDDSLATLQSTPWKVNSPWWVDSKLGEFVIKRKKLAIKRYYWIEGGPFSGTEIVGESWDRAYSIYRQEQLLAQADESSFSLRTEHRLNLIDSSQEVQLLSAIVATVVIKDKQSDRNNN